MSLRYALLALLTSQPMTGYELAKSFHVSVGHVWHAPDSQIYPALRRMTEEGLLRAQEVPWGEKTLKTQYSVTDAGIDSLRQWMESPIAYRPRREAAHLRAAYFDWGSAEVNRRQLRAHIKYFTELREQLTAQMQAIKSHAAPTIRARLTRTDESQWARIVEYKVFAYEGLVAQTQTEIDWAERGLRLIDRLEGEQPSEPVSH